MDGNGLNPGGNLIVILDVAGITVLSRAKIIILHLKLFCYIIGIRD